MTRDAAPAEMTGTCSNMGRGEDDRLESQKRVSISPAPGLITGSVATNGGLAMVLDVGDMITIDFAGPVLAPVAGNSFDMLEAVGGTTARLTCGDQRRMRGGRRRHDQGFALGGDCVRYSTILVPDDNSLITGMGSSRRSGHAWAT